MSRGALLLLVLLLLCQQADRFEAMSRCTACGLHMSAFTGLLHAFDAHELAVSS